jgi:hypothetical protein
MSKSTNLSKLTIRILETILLNVYDRLEKYIFYEVKMENNS